MRNFTHVVLVRSYAKLPKGILLSLTATKLLNLYCNHVVVSHVPMKQNVRRTKSARWLRYKKKPHCHSNNLQFANDYENSKCPPPAFTHAFYLLLKSLTALLMASCPRSLFYYFIFIL